MLIRKGYIKLFFSVEYMLLFEPNERQFRHKLILSFRAFMHFRLNEIHVLSF